MSKSINIELIQTPKSDGFSDIFRYRVEIANIDITSDLLKSTPIRISKSSDAIELTKYRTDSVSIALDNTDGKYDPDVAGNFWDANSLNAAGYQEEIKVYMENRIGGAWVSHLMFQGIIEGQAEAVSAVQVNVRASDISVLLERQRIDDFGTQTKWDTLRKLSDEESFEGVYVPEGSLVPIQPKTAEAYHDRTALTRSRLQLPTHGPPLQDTMYVSGSDVRVSGGFFEDGLPVAKFKTYPRSEDVVSLLNLLSLSGKEIYNIEIDAPEVALARPDVFNQGNVSFAVEDTRITRLPVDWVQSENRVLILLSNPEGHIADLLVQWDVARKSYRTLHTFGRERKVHRIERRDATNYYILTSSAISQDRSAQQLPRQSDKTAFVSDSVAEGSEIKIYHCGLGNPTPTLTEHVAEDDAYPPQLGRHYHVGFENDVYVDEFEGIVPEDRGTFKWVGSYLYYRYATDSEFGVARVNTGGTTSEMIDQARGGYWDHLNFAFDVDSAGTVYFVYATSDAETSTLTIKRRTRSGTETTILSETRGPGDFNELGFDFGAFLGVHEVLFYSNYLYMLAPIQKVDFGDDTQSIINPDVDIRQLTAEKTGERNVTTGTNLNPANQTVASGDDIPLRIDFDGVVSGATQDGLTVYGGTIQSFSISSDMIDVTIRPDSKTRHKTIIVDLAEDAVSQGNEAWRIIIDFETTRSRTKTAGMALYRVSTTAANPELEVVEKWDFVHLGGCNLVVHEGSAHYMEQPSVASQFKPVNPDLEDSYNEAMKYNSIPESLGALKKINTDGTVETLGNLWYAGDWAYNQALTRPLSFGGELHVVMGYGNTRELLKYNALASRADNCVHIRYGRKLQFAVPTFQPTGNRYSEIANIARKIGATVSFNNNLISVKDRRVRRATVRGSLAANAESVPFQGTTRAFPGSGHLRIGTEFLRYTDIINDMFIGITRGLWGTAAAAHADESDIVFVEAFLPPSVILQIDRNTDTTRYTNRIEDGQDIFEVSDAAGIEKYNEHPYTLDLGLTRNENAWIETMFNQYLSELKTLGKEVKLTLIAGKTANALDVGGVIGIVDRSRAETLRIDSITYSEKRVNISGRTV